MLARYQSESEEPAPIQGHGKGGIMTEPVTLKVFSDYV
jgi:hypothetical protein